MNRHQTLSILEWAITLMVIARAGISTWLVVLEVTHNTVYTAFTVAVIELVLLLSFLLMKTSPIAPITAILAIGFSAVTQVMELRVIEGTMSKQERDVLTYVIALAPIAVLLLEYVRRLDWQGMAGDRNEKPTQQEKQRSTQRLDAAPAMSMASETEALPPQTNPTQRPRKGG